MHCIKDITIILPTKNESKNIANFLYSVPCDIKLIMVDASTDKTVDIIKEIKPKNTEIYLHPGNISEARQFGSEMADTDWLLFSDADIVFNHNYFNNISKYWAFDIVYGPKLSIEEFKYYYKFISYGQLLLDTLGVPAASGSNLLIRKSLYERGGGFDTELVCNEDSEIVWRLKEPDIKVAFAPDLAVYATDHRRLYKGKIKKTIHSLARCSLLYLDIMPDKWRGKDWGYWA
ncbi:MAG: glycosyltransferase [Candidatus Dadabacteria bacterium]|nr:glycosyltransferase [Candidatus Dadabacteria bacterium]NIS08635.1 glycosyltransferase [Candidatus Dadabacteria bacterium]NIV42469.1 glycosyltransferase [Candidatus Dadabacteria bacterium]NIX15351.1 glycosyltransferase [Candidatus Dadabacteria bacterium]NIY22010.1 glycosyltransferase [Candidatus Dadabacteria bacterium]